MPDQSEDYLPARGPVALKPPACCRHCDLPIHIDNLWGWVHVSSGERFCWMTVAEPKTPPTRS